MQVFFEWEVLLTKCSRINKSHKKSRMVIFMDAERVFDKPQSIFSFVSLFGSLDFTYK